MADDGLIATYLRELDYSVRTLADGEDLVAEANDHLCELADRLVAAGRTRVEAEAEAVARFGSPAMLAKVSVTESRRGVSVPTRQTRLAGLLAVATPLMLIVGLFINVTVPRGFFHGVGVILLCAAIPAFIFVMWGMRARHGGLGRLGRVGMGMAIVSPFPAFGGWVGLFLAIALLSVAVLLLVIEMLRAGVLPVVPLALLAVGPFVVLATVIVGEVVEADVGGFAAYPMLLSIAGLLLLGRYMALEHPVHVPSQSTGPVAST